MHNKEFNNTTKNEKTNFASRIARVGGVAISLVESQMSQPLPGEFSEGFKQFMGAGVLTAGAVGVVGAMHVLDHYTGVGINPLNYAIALHHMTTY